MRPSDLRYLFGGYCATPADKHMVYTLKYNVTSDLEKVGFPIALRTNKPGNHPFMEPRIDILGIVTRLSRWRFELLRCSVAGLTLWRGKSVRISLRDIHLSNTFRCISVTSTRNLGL
jgi:hypothetical protein